MLEPPRDVDELPYVDEHAADVAAAPEATWVAALAVMRAAGSSAAVRAFAAAVGCDPRRSSASEPDLVGATIPGFRIVAARAPELLVLAGRHRFARYAIVLRIEPTDAGSRCLLQSRAAFPGMLGRLYRAAVIGSRGHVVGVRRLLADIRRRAEQEDRSPLPMGR